MSSLGKVFFFAGMSGPILKNLGLLGFVLKKPKNPENLCS